MGRIVHGRTIYFDRSTLFSLNLRVPIPHPRFLHTQVPQEMLTLHGELLHLVTLMQLKRVHVLADLSIPSSVRSPLLHFRNKTMKRKLLTLQEKLDFYEYTNRVNSMEQ
jgi:hypothetical protein